MRCIICVNDHNPDFEDIIFKKADDFAEHVYTIHNDTPNMEFFKLWFEQVESQRSAIIEKVTMLLHQAESCEKAREFINAHKHQEAARMLNNILLEV